MLKRLNRVVEAESDLNLALSFADGGYELVDIKYNLACVYALKGERNKMLDMVRELKSQRRQIGAIRFHLTDFFSKCSDDKEFLALLS